MIIQNENQGELFVQIGLEGLQTGQFGQSKKILRVVQSMDNRIEPGFGRPLIAG